MTTEVKFDTHVGPTYRPDGAGESVRQGRDASLVVSQSHGRHYEQASRGQLFAISGALAGTTIAAGHVAPPAAAAATLLSILNPPGSGYNLEVLEGTINHISGTPGAGSFAWCSAHQDDIVTAAEAVAIIRPLLTSSAKPKAIKAWSATTLTGSRVHTIMKVFPTTKFAGAIDVVSSELVSRDFVDGKIVVQPGWMLTLAPAATGTTHVVTAEIVVAEVPIQ